MSRFILEFTELVFLVLRINSCCAGPLCLEFCHGSDNNSDQNLICRHSAHHLVLDCQEQASIFLKNGNEKESGRICHRILHFQDYYGHSSMHLQRCRLLLLYEDVSKVEGPRDEWSGSNSLTDSNLFIRQ